MTRPPTPDVLGDILGGPPPKQNAIALGSIRTDGGTQMRAAINQETVNEYLEAMQMYAGWGDFPPVILFYDGAEYWLGDGFHRVAAFRLVQPNGAVPADVRAGTRRDAILHAAGANHSHGLRRSQADKRRGVETLLLDDEWRNWSDREIARRCHVSADLVADVRNRMYPPASPVTVDSDSEPPAAAPAQLRTYTTKHGALAVMDTSKIGKTEPSYMAVWVIERYVQMAIGDLYPQDADANGLIAQVADMRRQAKAGQGDLLTVAASLMDADSREFRKRDLVQAIHNVANQLRPNQPPVTVDSDSEKPEAAPSLAQVRQELGGNREARLATAARINKPLTEWTEADWAAYGAADAQPKPAAVPVSQRDDYDSDEWYTPEDVIRRAAHVMGTIDLDPASCEMAQTLVQAAAYYTKADDGLNSDWNGSVWLNPPYSQTQAWIDKLFKEMKVGRVNQAIVLCNNATETAWFQRLLNEAKLACFPARRLAFWRHDHSNVGARQGQCLFYFGPRPETFYSAFSASGVVIRRMK